MNKIKNCLYCSYSVPSFDPPNIVCTNPTVLKELPKDVVRLCRPEHSCELWEPDTPEPNQEDYNV